MTDTTEPNRIVWTLPDLVGLAAWSPVSDGGDRLAIIEVAIRERDVEGLPMALKELAICAVSKPRIHPAKERAELRKQLQQEQHKTECLRISRDEWKRKAEAAEAQSKGKITDEWRRRVAAGDEGDVA